jgi:hypothetical protein
MKVNIHNECSYFRLMNQTWFKRNIDWYKKFGDVVYDCSMTSADLTPIWAAFEGGLTYQLRRSDIKSDKQSESTSTLLFITWKSDGYNELRACVRLIECDKHIKWNGYKLREYCQRYYSQFSTYTGFIEDTWMINDGAVLTTRLKLDFTQRNWRDGVLDITILEGLRNMHIGGPVWLDPKM